MLSAAKTGGKIGEDEHDHKDQPDVIRLPDGANGMGNHLTLLGGARTSGQQVPDAAAEVGAAQQRVEQDAEEQDGAVEKRELILRIRPGHGGCPRQVLTTDGAGVDRAGAPAPAAAGVRGG